MVSSDLGPAERGAAGRAGEDDVLHLAAAQGLGALLAHHPGEGVDDVGLARAVGPDDAGDPRLELQGRRRGEGLEPAEGQALQVHAGSSPLWTTGRRAGRRGVAATPKEVVLPGPAEGKPARRRLTVPATGGGPARGGARGTGRSNACCPGRTTVLPLVHRRVTVPSRSDRAEPGCGLTPGLRTAPRPRRPPPSWIPFNQEISCPSSAGVAAASPPPSALASGVTPLALWGANAAPRRGARARQRPRDQPQPRRSPTPADEARPARAQRLPRQPRDRRRHQLQRPDQRHARRRCGLPRPRAPRRSARGGPRAGATPITVAAGDLVGASPLLSAAFHDEPTIKAMNQVGLDVASVGNHEFDEGYRELLRMQRGGCLEDGGRRERPELLPGPGGSRAPSSSTSPPT